MLFRRQNFGVENHRLRVGIGPWESDCFLITTRTALACVRVTRARRWPLACNKSASGNSSFYLLPPASPLTHIDWHQPGITRFLTNGDGCLREPGLRQGYDK